MRQTPKGSTGALALAATIRFRALASLALLLGLLWASMAMAAPSSYTGGASRSVPVAWGGDALGWVMPQGYTAVGRRV